ncbi:GNAT family N-acetyltransferase [Candidatus Enterococcus ferrettii]|uniref:N-acetyltransferase domain-containing protein n=1 Tax=Candidatus Enterococcus ferrettii TaxID=2815324 RepID=A0ABV0EQ00_9ENTE|nr:GNAT family N-acetyltransferase [Enterococcus sp. 665A]MBO1338948.1 GNAT family N-acetyltransferase [Enterococcus sp. 665A]
MEKPIHLRVFEDHDRKLMEDWLYQDYVRQWLIHPENWLMEVDQRHGKFNWIHHYIVMLDGDPIGFCQYYDCFRAKELKEWLDVEESGRFYSLDYLIGNPAFLGKGYGKQIIKHLIGQIQQQETGVREVLVEPDHENISSNKVLLANDFIYDSEKGYYRKAL